MNNISTRIANRQIMEQTHGQSSGSCCQYMPAYSQPDQSGMTSCGTTLDHRVSNQTTSKCNQKSVDETLSLTRSFTLFTLIYKLLGDARWLRFPAALTVRKVHPSDQLTNAEGSMYTTRACIAPLPLFIHILQLKNTHQQWRCPILEFIASICRIIL